MWGTIYYNDLLETSDNLLISHTSSSLLHRPPAAIRLLYATKAPTIETRMMEWPPVHVLCFQVIQFVWVQFESVIANHMAGRMRAAGSDVVLTSSALLAGGQREALPVSEVIWSYGISSSSTGMRIILYNIRAKYIHHTKTPPPTPYALLIKLFTDIYELQHVLVREVSWALWVVNLPVFDIVTCNKTYDSN